MGYSRLEPGRELEVREYISFQRGRDGFYELTECSSAADSTSSADSPPQLTANQPTIRKKPPETDSSGGFHIIDRIEVDTVLLKLKMQVRAGSHAGLPHLPQLFPCLYSGAGADADMVYTK